MFHGVLRVLRSSIHFRLFSNKDYKVRDYLVCEGDDLVLFRPKVVFFLGNRFLLICSGFRKFGIVHFRKGRFYFTFLFTTLYLFFFKCMNIRSRVGTTRGYRGGGY